MSFPGTSVRLQDVAIVAQHATLWELDACELDGVVHLDAALANTLAQRVHVQRPEGGVDRLGRAVVVCKLKPTEGFRSRLAIARGAVLHHLCVEPNVEFRIVLVACGVEGTEAKPTVEGEVGACFFHPLDPAERGAPMR